MKNILFLLASCLFSMGALATIHIDPESWAEFLIRNNQRALFFNASFIFVIVSSLVWLKWIRWQWTFVALGVNFLAFVLSLILETRMIKIPDCFTNIGLWLGLGGLVAICLSLILMVVRIVHWKKGGAIILIILGGVVIPRLIAALVSFCSFGFY